MLLWGPDVTAGSAGGIGIFYVIALGHPGKGKTTAALGLAFRALKQGVKVGIVQFINAGIKAQRGVEF